MSNKKYRYIFFVIIYITGCLFLFPVYAFCDEDKQIAIVVSKRIRPYMNVVEGIAGGLKENFKITQVFFLSESDLQHNEKISLRLANGQFDFFTAVGPEATELLWGLKTDLSFSSPEINNREIKKIFTAVLDPERLLKNQTSQSQCGVSLRIPVDTQVHEITETFSGIKRIGLLFDERNNDWFFEKAYLASKKYGITIIPLQVRSRSHITQVLSENWENIDCIWMIPDRTVISEKIIQHIIKLGIYNKKGVIGYNSFFTRSGALFSFDFDYKALGTQTAQKIETYFKTGGGSKTLI